MSKYQLKDDSQQFMDHIDVLKNEKWLDKSRSWWPMFIFHFTNINNAVNILESGKLRCRYDLEKLGGMSSDNASVAVIEQTDERWKKYVRLVFQTENSYSI